jgi:hypothetical protein
VAYNFQTEKNKIKLLKEYESVTPKVLLLIELILQNVKQNFLSSDFIFLNRFYFIVSGLKILGHGNPDNNLESYCVLSWRC